MADPKPLLDLIARHESTGAATPQGVASDYDVVWGGIPRGHRPQALLAKPLTAMTLREVLDWQRDVVRRGSASSAAGRYQFIRATLDGTRLLESVALDALFDAPTQDRLAFRLLRNRGWDKLIAGTMDLDSFAEALAREWASLPVLRDQQGASRPVTRGQSFYAGDGLNRASASPDDVLTAISAAMLARPAPVAPPSDALAAEVAALRRRVEQLESFRAGVLAAAQLGAGPV